MHSGSCLCGAVRFTLPSILPAPEACHCSMCRKTTGHFFVSVEVQKVDVQMTGVDPVTWYTSSEKVRRGFCGKCGSTLFFEPIFHTWTAVAAGCLDEPIAAPISRHIFVADKGAYYEILDDAPQKLQ
ncbi:aldehyde-activating protein [Falsihalocynthiibacter arcticus]|uniref:Aldehyde-activating protein n=2 Tax=Falsihalocynthiibacter arcticus TaxID=1579316 RepID=A0A126UX04_9RHOB|nr:aldehyde-activating protein [Falsihalocynthiibacter arcticus]